MEGGEGAQPRAVCMGRPETGRPRAEAGSAQLLLRGARHVSLCPGSLPPARLRRNLPWPRATWAFVGTALGAEAWGPWTGGLARRRCPERGVTVRCPQLSGTEDRSAPLGG